MPSRKPKSTARSFPTVEKIAKVTPIFKSGESSLFDNYRPISVLNSISKIVEKIVCKQLTTYLESQNLLFKHQYSFRKSKCTQDAIMYVHDYICKNMNQKNYTGAMFVDLRKAFDTVSHACLLSKLLFYGITGIELNWFSDYLFNRKQYVNFENTTSKSKSFNLGVPQGSILGPLLFLLLINDAYQCLEKCTMLMYADDTVLLYSSPSSKSVTETLSRDGYSLFSWFQKNDLIVNLKPGKTETVLFGTAQNLRNQPSTEVRIDGQTINKVNRYKYLGVTFDHHMNFSEQLSEVSKKVSQRINMLKRVRINITSATTNIIYNSMIAPMMLYCSPVYLRLPGVHQKFTKPESRAYKTIKTQPQITNTITNKMKQRSAIEVFKHIHQLKKNNIIKFDVFQHNISTRGNGNRLVIPKSNNEAGRRSFNTQGALIFNLLPEHIRNEKSILLFKRLIKNFKF